MKPLCFFVYQLSALPITFAILTFISGCSDSRPIKIAFIGAVSGKHSEVGTSVRNAVLMKIDSVNLQGGINGRQIELVVFDNKGDTTQCADQFQKILSEKIPFAIGPIFSQMAEATLNAIQGKDLLVLSPTMSTSHLSGKDDNFLRTIPSSDGQAIKIAEYIIARGYRKIGVVYDLSNEKYTIPLYNMAKKLVEKEGVQIVAEKAIDQNNTKDLHVIALTLLVAEPDCILMCLSALDGANLAQQLRKAGSNASFIGVSWTQTNDLLEHGGRAVEGMVLVSLPEKSETTGAHREFENKYRDKFNTPPSFPAFLGYDAASTILLGMQKAKSLTPEAVKKAIISQGEIKGLSDTITINKFGDVKGHYDLVQVHNNKFDYLDF